MIPALWTLPGLTRPVDVYGSKERFHSRPPSAWKSPVKLEIPTVPWKTLCVSHERPQALRPLAFTSDAKEQKQMNNSRTKAKAGIGA